MDFSFTSVPVLPAFGQSSLPSYYKHNHFLLAPPGSVKFDLYGCDNPAVTSFVREPDISLLWSDENGEWNSFNGWVLFAAAPGIGFGLIHERYGSDYKVSLTTGHRTLNLGIATGWSGS